MNRVKLTLATAFCFAMPFLTKAQSVGPVQAFFGGAPGGGSMNIIASNATNQTSIIHSYTTLGDSYNYDLASIDFFEMYYVSPVWGAEGDIIIPYNSIFTIPYGIPHTYTQGSVTYQITAFASNIMQVKVTSAPL